MSSVELGDLKSDLLRVGLVRVDTVFANGQNANNKVELDSAALDSHPDLRDRVVSVMARMVEAYDPEFIVGVPEGATSLGTWVARYLGIKHNPILIKRRGVIDYAVRGVDDEMVADLSRGVMVEDVINRRSTTNKALAIGGLGPKIVAVVAVLDRGVDEECEPIGRPLHPVVRQPIPAMLPPDSPIWQYLTA